MGVNSTASVLGRFNLYDSTVHAAELLRNGLTVLNEFFYMCLDGAMDGLNSQISLADGTAVSGTTRWRTTSVGSPSIISRSRRSQCSNDSI